MFFLNDIGNLLLVLSAFGLSLTVPPLIVSLWICEQKSWKNIFLVAFSLGISGQGILGFLCNHYLRIGIAFETAIYYLGWLLISIIVLLSQRTSKPFKLSATREDLLLTGLLLLAVAVRSVHPLQHMALGQSDAYSHLQFLRNVVDTGFVHNVMYPPGYHWLLALPTQSFQLDPYLVARYAGAFFGAGLVLAVYVLVGSITGSTAALIAAFLVSCFPGFYLLLKTGVGAFANQLGLFFIPVIFYFFIITEGKKLEISKASYALLALCLMGLSISVPMMLIHVLLILCIIRMILLLARRNQWLSQTIFFTLSILPAIILLSFHLLHAGPVHQQETIKVITAGAATNLVTSISDGISKETGPDSSAEWMESLKSAGNHPAVSLVRDFFSGKRFGVGHFAANIIMFLMMTLFGITLLWGLRSGNIGLVVLGIWGGIASLQTMTGALQFSGYQREGWSFMIAFACLLGILGGAVYCWGKRWILFKVTVVVFVMVSIICSFIYPPEHTLMSSCAEDDIIRLVRQISSRYTVNHYWMFADKPTGGEYTAAFSSERPLTIVARQMTGWQGSEQGELIHSIISPSEQIRVKTVSSGSNFSNNLSRNGSYLILLDEMTEDCLQDQIWYAMIDPQQVQRFRDGRQSFYKINDAIRSYLDGLDRNLWRIAETKVNQHLLVCALEPTGNTFSDSVLRDQVKP